MSKFNNYFYNFILKIGLVFLMSFIAIRSYSQTDSKKTKPAPNVLDFEADVIEGERTAPSILIQMDLQAPNLDTLVFQRKNFNDFHIIDMKRKPKFRGNN